MIEGLCREVEKRMTAVGVKGTKVTLKVKQRKDGAPPPPKFLGHGKCNNLSKCKDVPVGTYATRDWACFYELAAIMFAEMKVLKDDVRGMGITVCKLVKDGTSESGGKSSKSSISSWFAGKAPDACVSDVQDNGERPDSPEGVNTDEDSVVVLSQVNEVRIPRYQSDFEIALPAFSQIRMSQVEELPLDMRHLILSKMEKERQSRSVPVCTTSFAENIPQDARYRQTDVKRMFRLASMKTGNYRVGDNDISLTQLDQLPLEMQLQVANDDLQRMGTLSPQKKIQKPSTTLCSNRTRHDKNVSIPRGSIDAIVLRNEEEGLEVVTYPELAADSTNTQFFTDNVLPLSIFMDENSDANAEAIDQVVQYLQLCVTENRLQDVVVLLRSIWHRKDRWKTISFDSIFTAVNEKFDQITGSRLDRDWVVR